MGRGYLTADRKGRYADELPPHLVSISAFRMGTTPVTVGMWREYTAANRKLRMPAAPEWGWLDDHPMVNVNWLDIVGKKAKVATSPGHRKSLESISNYHPRHSGNTRHAAVKMSSIRGATPSTHQKSGPLQGSLAIPERPHPSSARSARLKTALASSTWLGMSTNGWMTSMGRIQLTHQMFEIRRAPRAVSFAASAGAHGTNTTLTASAAPTEAPAAPNIPAGHAAAFASSRSRPNHVW